MKRSFKKALSILLAVTMVFGTVAFGLSDVDWSEFTIRAEAATSGICGDNLTWSYDESTSTLTISGTGEMYDYVKDDGTNNFHDAPWYYIHPNTIVVSEGVTSIGDYAFYSYGVREKYGLKNVTLPESLVSIGEGAFLGSYLSKIVIPDKVTDIGNRAFSSLDLLESVVFGDSVENIGEYAFYECNLITNVEFPETLKSLGTGAFNGLKQLESVDFNNSSAIIGEKAFYECEKLVDLELGDSIKEIGEYAFYGCSSLEKFLIPDSVIKIGAFAFDATAYYWNDENWESGEYGVGGLYIGNHLVQFYYKDSYNNYVIKEGTTTICTLSSDLTSVVIPESVTYLPNGAFSGSKIKSITIPASVTSIGNRAFSHCSELSSVIFAEGSKLESIGDSAFSNCISLTSVSLPDTVKEIGANAFFGCLNLKQIDLGDGIEKIGADAFKESNYYINEDNWNNGVLYVDNCLACASENSITGDYAVKEGTRAIADGAFGSQKEMTGITFPSSLVSIGDEFLSVNYTQSFAVSLGKNVKYIGENAFSDNTLYYIDEENQFYSSDEYGTLFNKDKTELIEFDSETTDVYQLPDSVVRIHPEAFLYSKISVLTFGDNSQLEIIDESAFESSDITSIVFPENSRLKVIGTNSFEDCDKLTDVVLPDSLLTISYESFKRCSVLKNITFGEKLIRIGSSAFISCVSLERLNFNKNLTVINSSAFSDCTALSKLNFRQDGCLTYIGMRAFWLCSNIKNLALPDSVYEISGEAFLTCTGLETVALGNGVVVIGSEAFCGCDSLTTFSIGKSVTELGDGILYGCDSLTSITVSSENKYYSNDEDGVLFTKSKGAIIQYPVGKPNTTYEVPKSVSTIRDSAFGGSKALEKVVLHEGVLWIADDAFENCTALSEINIPSDAYYIGQRAFRNCVSLKSIVWSAKETEIDEKTFDGCSSLENIIIPEGVKKIDSGAFQGCLSLKEVVLPSTLATIGNAAFSGCSSIKSVVIPEGVTSIGNEVFSGCTSLEKTYISSTVKSIGGSPFASCTSLKEIVVADNNKYYASDLFGALYDVDYTTLYQYPCGSESASYSIIETTAKTSGSPFAGAVNLTSMSIPKSLTSISGLELNTNKNISSVYYYGSPDMWAELTKYYNLEHITVTFAEEDSYVSVTDTESDVTCTYLSNFYEGEVAFNIKREIGLASFDVITTQLDVSRNEIYDITMTLDNVKIQPNGSVTVRIPLPEGYDPERTHVYYIGVQDGGLKNMRAEYIDGYMVFNTTHFSHYAIIELNEPVYSITWIVDGVETIAEYKEGDAIAHPENPVKEGYTFVGWDSEIPKKMPANNLIFTAKFEKISENSTTVPVVPPIKPTEPVAQPTTKPIEVPSTKPAEPSTDPSTKPTEPTTKPIVTVPTATVEIRKPSQTEIKYGDSIILHADVEGKLPEGATIKWTADNGNFTIVETSADGKACTVTPNSSGDTVFTATVVDADGNIVATDTQTMTSKAGFFRKIIAFFKKLFGLTKVIPEAVKNIF